jgi:acyl CoA:acetate/3-ketoacid CoA transferase alpha subunit
MGKVAPLDEAVAVIEDGAHVGLTGFAITRNNVAVAHALIRAGRRDLTVSQVIGGLETDLLAAGGCLRRVEYSGGSLDRFGQLFALNRAIGRGEVEVVEYSSLALTLRFHAGALGLPFLASRSMLGSDLLEPLLIGGAVRLGEDPFAGGPVVLLAPLRPDVVFVHADVADASGNASVSGPTWALRETAYAGRHVVVVCEELVPVGSIDPDRVVVPGAVVDAVTVVPRGAHPTAVQGRYDYDRAHLVEYAALSREGGDAHAQYLGRYVHQVDRFEQYLDLVEHGT